MKHEKSANVLCEPQHRSPSAGDAVDASSGCSNECHGHGVWSWCSSVFASCLEGCILAVWRTVKASGRCDENILPTIVSCLSRVPFICLQCIKAEVFLNILCYCMQCVLSRYGIFLVISASICSLESVYLTRHLELSVAVWASTPSPASAWG